MSRIRNIKNLFYKYGMHVGLDEREVAKALSEAGAIELIDDKNYREVESTEIKQELFNDIMFDILKDYKAREIAKHKGDL